MPDKQRLQILRAVDKLDRLGPKAVLDLLTVGRRDVSGDFAEGAGLGLHSARFVMNAIGVPTEVVCYRPELSSAIIFVGEH